MPNIGLPLLTLSMFSVPLLAEPVHFKISYLYLKSQLLSIYTIKISKSVCVFVCVSGYTFRHALRYRAENWHGGRGRAHEVCGHTFEATPPKVKGHPEVNLPWECPMATQFGEKNP